MGNTTRKEVAKESTKALQRAIKEGSGFILLIDGDDDKHYSKQVHMLSEGQQLNMLLSAMKASSLYQAIEAADNVGDILADLIKKSVGKDETKVDDLPDQMPDELKKIINELRDMGANIKVSVAGSDEKPEDKPDYTKVEGVEGGELTKEKIDEFLAEVSEKYDDDDFSSVILTLKREKGGVRIDTAMNASAAQAGDMIDMLVTENPSIGRYLGKKKIGDLVDKISKK